MFDLKQWIAKVTNAIVSLTNRQNIKVAYGNVGDTGPTVNANSYKDVSVSFNTTFPSTPRVIISLRSSSTSSEIGLMTVSAINVTTTGFTARFFNAGSSGRSPNAEWVAIQAIS